MNKMKFYSFIHTCVQCLSASSTDIISDFCRDMSGYSEEFITNKLKEALEADHVEVVDQGNSYFYC